jgi:hypothetical protein
MIIIDESMIRYCDDCAICFVRFMTHKPIALLCVVHILGLIILGVFFDTWLSSTVYFLLLLLTLKRIELHTAGGNVV